MYALILSIYPMMVILYTWSHVLRSDFQGGRHGPLDAYRHTLASAVVSYTLGVKAVNIVTWVMESKGKASNTMDRHNNSVGARIGATVSGFSEIEPAVRQRIHHGAIDATNDHQTTWMPEDTWRKGRLW